MKYAVAITYADERYVRAGLSGLRSSDRKRKSPTRSAVYGVLRWAIER